MKHLSKPLAVFDPERNRWYPVPAGGSEDGDGEGGNDEGSESEEDGDEGADGSLIEEGDPDGGSDDGEDGEEAGADVSAAIVDAVTEKLAERFDSIADRRVNALLKEIRKQNAGGSTDENEDEGTESTQDRTTLREAKVAFREYVGDTMKFVSADERALAMSLGQGILSGMSIEDEDRAGREVADQVAEQIKALRSMYEERVLSALRKRGVLAERPGQRQKSTGNGAAASNEYERGAEKARKMFASTATAKE